MYVIVDVVMPSKLTKKQKDLFKELSETTLDDDSKFTKFNKMLKKIIYMRSKPKVLGRYFEPNFSLKIKSIIYKP
ncbi:MAG: hypothetical protein ACLUG3_05365 [Bacilli bacterium]